jgi:hypothetical protein
MESTLINSTMMIQIALLVGSCLTRIFPAENRWHVSGAGRIDFNATAAAPEPASQQSDIKLKPTGFESIPHFIFLPSV